MIDPTHPIYCEECDLLNVICLDGYSSYRFVGTFTFTCKTCKKKADSWEIRRDIAVKCNDCGMVEGQGIDDTRHHMTLFYFISPTGISEEPEAWKCGICQSTNTTYADFLVDSEGAEYHDDTWEMKTSEEEGWQADRKVFDAVEVIFEYLKESESVGGEIDGWENLQKDLVDLRHKALEEAS